jgi:site-specific recombinase XerD
MLLRLVRPPWPPKEKPDQSDAALFHDELVHGYLHRMRNLRGLSIATTRKQTQEARWFLKWLGPLGEQANIRGISVRQIDDYTQWRSTSLGRASLASAVSDLRQFLGFLHLKGVTDANLSAVGVSPRVYRLERIPSAFRPSEVTKIMDAANEDQYPYARRNRAALTLLINYGLRAGEVIRLRLDDIDWENGVLTITQSKTSKCTNLPLTNEVGNALIDYIRNERPSSEERQLFLQAVAPYGPLRAPGMLHHIIARYLRKTNIERTGKKGPHAFRHAIAVSMLRKDVPLKVIGDVLGHQSLKATMIYLKLATNDLRKVATSLPRRKLQ